MPARPRIVKLQNYSWAKYWLTAKGARPEVGGLYCIMNKPAVDCAWTQTPTNNNNQLSIPEISFTISFSMILVLCLKANLREGFIYNPLSMWSTGCKQSTVNSIFDSTLTHSEDKFSICASDLVKVEADANEQIRRPCYQRHPCPLVKSPQRFMGHIHFIILN